MDNFKKIRLILVLVCLIFIFEGCNFNTYIEKETIPVKYKITKIKPPKYLKVYGYSLEDNTSEILTLFSKKRCDVKIEEGVEVWGFKTTYYNTYDKSYYHSYFIPEERICK